ncbi:hypothetical protein I312_103962 [Cryptococcus bacillisporus CA1280]
MTVYLWFFAQYLFVQNFGLFSPFLGTDKLAWFPILDAICSSGVQSYFAYLFPMTGRRDSATNDIHVDVETYVHDIHFSDDVRDKKNHEDNGSLSDIQDHRSLGFNSQSHLTEPRHAA